MADELTWTKIHDEREALLADLETLSDAQWQTPSLCEGWTVQQVVAHLIGSATTTKLGFLKGMVARRGNIEALMNDSVKRHSSGTPAETLAAYRDAVHNHTSAPVPTHSLLGEIVVHGEDIRRPLGLTREYPAETLRGVADFYKNSNLLMGSRKRIDGLHLMATDQEWGHGEGEIVEGPLLALIMTMTGRPAFLEDLGGDGLLTYRARFSGENSTK